MTTVTTTGHQRTPLIAALAAGAALVVGGAIGVAWEQNNDTPAATHAQTTTPNSFGGATTSNEFSGAPGGATTADEFSGTTSGSIPATGSPDGYTTSQGCRGCRRR
jgi:hypothetical protein